MINRSAAFGDEARSPADDPDEISRQTVTKENTTTSTVTRESLLEKVISDAIGVAFNDGKMHPDGSRKAVLSGADCCAIADVVHDTIGKPNLGAYGRRTIHGGRM